jgi:alkanesulfonate monooxygenase SsuD/methylene tetrahydromethanopterin reductase-like flavin-dependent oxidoreductase (luciferase family)
MTALISAEATATARRNMYGQNALNLGLFCVNASSGRSLTLAPERWSANWPDNVAVARLADEAGIDFLLPLGRWKGYSGTTNAQGATYETLTWATAMLALTRRITVFSTVHAPLVNPIAAAKMMVTNDHAGGGRAGLNIVVGWNEEEFEMFGVPQRDQPDRYPYAQEWIDVIKRIWSSNEEFDYDGRFLKLKNVEGNPKPIGGTRPAIMNAARSGEGIAYAIRNCDAWFTDISTSTLAEAAQTVETFKARAAAEGRDLDVYSDALVVCRPTTKEAQEYYHYTHVENVDWLAIETFLAKKNVRPDNTPAAEYEAARVAYARRMAGKIVVGDPDTVAAEFAGISSAGVRGMAMNFVNYRNELPYICEEVLPRLQRLGLRAAT